jgi:hypothetical protein
MIELEATHVETIPELFEVVGEPSEESKKRLEDTVRGEAVITSWLLDKNKIWLGKPQAHNLLNLAQESGESLPPTMTTQVANADFILVQFACSFRPAPDCEFIRASMQVHLEADGAIAYDMFPREVGTTITTSRKFSISPEFMFKFAKTSEIGLSGIQAEKSIEYIIYEPQITPFALGESTPGWDFNKTKAKPIQGTRELFLIVKRPRGVPVYARFELSATVQTNVGRIPLSTFFLLSGGYSPLIDERYLIC